MGKRKSGVRRFDHIVDDDDQNVLTVASLSSTQLAGLSNFMIHVVNGSGLSLEQSAFSASEPLLSTPRAFWTAPVASVLLSMCS